MFIGCEVRFNSDLYEEALKDRIGKIGPYFDDEFINELKSIQHKNLVVTRVFKENNEEYLGFENTNFAYSKKYFYVVNKIWRRPYYLL